MYALGICLHSPASRVSFLWTSCYWDVNDAVKRVMQGRQVIPENAGVKAHPPTHLPTHVSMREECCQWLKNHWSCSPQNFSAMNVFFKLVPPGNSGLLSTKMNLAQPLHFGQIAFTCNLFLPPPLPWRERISIWHPILQHLQAGAEHRSSDLPLNKKRKGLGQ